MDAPLLTTDVDDDDDIPSHRAFSIALPIAICNRLPSSDRAFSTTLPTAIWNHLLTLPSYMTSGSISMFSSLNLRVKNSFTSDEASVPSLLFLSSMF